VYLDGQAQAAPLLVGVALTLGDRPFNLMLARGLDVVCKTLDELSDLMHIGKITVPSNPIE
jgi:hypothetical protein